MTVLEVDSSGEDVVEVIVVVDDGMVDVEVTELEAAVVDEVVVDSAVEDVVEVIVVVDEVGVELVDKVVELEVFVWML